MWPVYIKPVPIKPTDSETQEVDRHIGLWCGCFLIDCCHNEDQYTHSMSRHIDSGDPRTGYLYPFEGTYAEWMTETYAPYATRRTPEQD